MKKNLLFIAGALLLTSGANAQITLSNSSYTSSQVRNDSFKAATAASTHPSFAAASNATWDLTTMTDSINYTVINRVTALPATFADSNHYSLGSNAYQGNVISNIAAGGYTQSGINITNATYPISGAGPTDSIYILAQNTVFTATASATPSPRTVIKFPATMSTTWTSNYESDFNYEVSYAPIYVHAAGKIKSYITETNTVIGWGKMKVKTATGIASGSMNVLQVRTQITRVDTFYLNGGTSDPGLSTLLGLLSLTQGQVTTTYEQNFYRADEVSPLAMATFSDAANTTVTGVTTHKQRLANATAVTNVANEANVKVYPNPVTGRTISIDVPAATGVWSYELINITGQTIAANALQMNNGHAQVQLAATVTPGIYYIRVINDGNQVVVKPVDIN